MNIVDIFYKPTAVFTDIKKTAAWVQSFIILSILSIVVAYFMLPINEIVSMSMAQSKGLTPEQMEITRTATEKFKYFGLVALPISLVFGIAITSVLLYLGLLAYKVKVKFVKIFSLITTASVLTALGVAVNVAILYIRGLDAVKGMGDMNVIGLNLFFKVDEVGLPLYQFLAGINLFTLWYALIVIFGLSKIADLKIGKSAVIFLYSWALIALCSFAMSVFSEIMTKK